LLPKSMRFASKMYCITLVAFVASTTNGTFFERFSHKRSAATHFREAAVVVFGVLRRIVPIIDQLIERPFAESSSFVITRAEAVDFGWVEVAERCSAEKRLIFLASIGTLTEASLGADVIWHVIVVAHDFEFVSMILDNISLIRNLHHA
jgi:hypothetical protein